jgi:predicted dehydrogenase
VSAAPTQPRQREAAKRSGANPAGRGVPRTPTRSFRAGVRPRACGGARPRLCFLGTGWIGRSRLAAVVASGAAMPIALADPDPAALAEALALAPGALPADGIEDLLALEPDGIVIATPSAQHATQAIMALEAGVAVFCQKPLARDVRETAAVLSAAEGRDRLLGVDLSYRLTAAAQALRGQVRGDALGPITAVELVFHNAYGPDKPWFLDPALSGGGCVIDLATHLLDLLLWTLPHARVEAVDAQLWRRGEPAAGGEAEDLCLATLGLAGGAVARLACSWFSHEGREAVIEVAFRGRDGAAAMHNVGGSFYDLRAELRRGTAARALAEPPDAWSGRATVAWVRRLAHDRGFDAELRSVQPVAEALDRIYGR